MTYSAFAENLLNARARKGLTQKLAAIECQCSKRTYCAWEGGMVRPHVHQCPALAQYLKIDVTEVLDLLNEES